MKRTPYAESQNDPFYFVEYGENYFIWPQEWRKENRNKVCNTLKNDWRIWDIFSSINKTYLILEEAGFVI